MSGYRFGKHPPKQDYRTLRLRNYLTSTLAAPPPSYDVLSNVYAKLNISDPKHLYPIFGGVYLGFQVQENCIQEFNAGQPWTPGPLTQDGHAVFAVGYDPTGVTVLTWGSTQKATWEWWDECVDEAYAILPQEAKASDFVAGFNFAQLKADLSAVAN